MRILRALLGSLLWIVAGLLGLLGVVLSITVILAPIGIPLLMLARRVFKYSMVLFLPRKVRHPANELGKSAREAAGKIPGSEIGKKAKKTQKKAGKKVGKKAGKKAGKLVRRQRKRLPV